MTEYDFIHNEEGSGYHVEYLNSGSLSYEVATLFGTQDQLGGIVDTGSCINSATTGNSMWAPISGSPALRIASIPLPGYQKDFSRSERRPKFCF
jgi:hypothetical protein